MNDASRLFIEREEARARTLAREFMPICLVPSYAAKSHSPAPLSLAFDLCPRYACLAGVALLGGAACLISYSRPRWATSA